MPVNVVLAPGQIVVVPVMVGTRPAATVTAIVLLAVQPVLVTVTV